MMGINLINQNPLQEINLKKILLILQQLIIIIKNKIKKEKIFIIIMLDKMEDNAY